MINHQFYFIEVSPADIWCIKKAICEAHYYAQTKMINQEKFYILCATVGDSLASGTSNKTRKEINR